MRVIFGAFLGKNVQVDVGYSKAIKQLVHLALDV